MGPRRSLHRRCITPLWGGAAVLLAAAVFAEAGRVPLEVSGPGGVAGSAAVPGRVEGPGPIEVPGPVGVPDAQRAWQHWTLNCQGCHRADGMGSAATTPSLAGTVARFLSAPGGRDYLGRVPGVASSALSDEDLCEVLNWMLWRFDAAHLPADFQPFSAAEVARLRRRPLRLEASVMRAELLQQAGVAPQ